jgi:DNA-binding NarL/FixJ family response regulator
MRRISVAGRHANGHQYDTGERIGSHTGNYRFSAHIRIIGLSINNQPAYARNMLQLGARGYMTKNSPREEMVKAILTVMEGGVYICDEIKQKMYPREIIAATLLQIHSLVCSLSLHTNFVFMSMELSKNSNRAL